MFVIIISPGESIHVRPNIKLLTLVGGGTKSMTTASFLRVTRVLQIMIAKPIITSLLANYVK